MRRELDQQENWTVSRGERSGQSERSGPRREAEREKRTVELFASREPDHERDPDRLVELGVSGFLCVRRLGELAFGQFFFCLQAPAKPPEVLWLGRAHMVQLLIGWLAPAA
jgi:hypothetical protein